MGEISSGGGKRVEDEDEEEEEEEMGVREFCGWDGGN